MGEVFQQGNKPKTNDARLKADEVHLGFIPHPSTTFRNPREGFQKVCEGVCNHESSCAPIATEDSCFV